MADSASAPAPAAPATAGERRRPTAAPGPIELSDEKTVQTLATPDSFGAPMARLSPSPTGHGYGSTPPSASTARRGARIHSFFLPPTGAHSTTPAPRTTASSERLEGRRPSSSPCEPLATPRDAETANTTPYTQNASPISGRFRDPQLALVASRRLYAAAAPPNKTQKTYRPPQGARRAPTARTVFQKSTAAACRRSSCATPSSPPTV